MHSKFYIILLGCFEGRKIIIVEFTDEEKQAFNVFMRAYKNPVEDEEYSPDICVIAEAFDSFEEAKAHTTKEELYRYFKEDVYEKF